MTVGNEWNCDCASTVVFGNASPETAAQYSTNPSWQASVKWSRPASNRLLLEAGSTNVFGGLDSTLFGAGGVAGGSVDDPYVLDSQRNYGYGGVRSLGLNGGLGPLHLRPDESDFFRLLRDGVPFGQGGRPVSVGHTGQRLSVPGINEGPDLHLLWKDSPGRGPLCHASADADPAEQGRLLRAGSSGPCGS